MSMHLVFLGVLCVLRETKASVLYFYSALRASHSELFLIQSFFRHLHGPHHGLGLVHRLLVLRAGTLSATTPPPAWM